MLENEVYQLLKGRGLTVSFAESCTGGRICDRITNVPGSSEVLMGGVVAYSNDSKRKLLGVRPETLERHGAVSEECALEMAKGVRDSFGTDVGVSVTGIAGPGGATPLKPVGLVYIAIAVPDGARAYRHIFPGDREAIKSLSADEALLHVIGSLR